MAAFAARYNASWLRERHSYKTPDQIRAEQKALETDAATAVEWRHDRRKALSHNRALVQSLMNVVAQQMTALCPTAQHIRRDLFTGVVDGLAIASASAFED